MSLDLKPADPNTPPPSLRKELFIDALCGAADTPTKFELLEDFIDYQVGKGWEIDRAKLKLLTLDEAMNLYSKLKAEEVRNERKS